MMNRSPVPEANARSFWVTFKRFRAARIASPRALESTMSIFPIGNYFSICSSAGIGTSGGENSHAAHRLGGGITQRVTRDADLPGFGDSSLPALSRTFREIGAIEVEDDGVTFNLDSVQGEPIQARGIRRTAHGSARQSGRSCRAGAGRHWNR